MMKQYDVMGRICFNEVEYLVVGDASEIKAIYKSLIRAYAECRTWYYYPSHLEMAKFVTGRTYGILINDNGMFSVINSNTIAKWFISDDVVLEDRNGDV